MEKNDSFKKPSAEGDINLKSNTMKTHAIRRHDGNILIEKRFIL